MRQKKTPRTLGGAGEARLERGAWATGGSGGAQKGPRRLDRACRAPRVRGTLLETGARHREPAGLHGNGAAPRAHGPRRQGRGGFPSPRKGRARDRRARGPARSVESCASGRAAGSLRRPRALGSRNPRASRPRHAMRRGAGERQGPARRRSAHWQGDEIDSPTFSSPFSLARRCREPSHLEQGREDYHRLRPITNRA